MLEPNKQWIPLKSYFLNIRIDSVNQILRDKESQINLECKFTDQNYRPEDSMCIFMFIKW